MGKDRKKSKKSKEPKTTIKKISKRKTKDKLDRKLEAEKPINKA